jgi:hypothetical protein
MEIYDGSGDPSPEPKEERAFFDLLAQLSYSNRSRYIEQAKELLNQGRLLLPIGNNVLKYIVKDGWTGYKVSEDFGVNYSDFLALGPLPWRRMSKIERLIDQFALSEARLTLDIN